MNIPSVTIELQVERQPMMVSQVPTIEKISMELSKGSLDTLLDGLGKIRDQLSTMS